MSPYVNGPDEYLLNKDLDVALWIDFRTHRGETPLKEVCRNDFVVVNNELHQEFDDFKKEQSIDLQQRSIVPLNELIEVYVHASGINPKAIEMNGRRYILMNMFEIDDLCIWIVEKREEVEASG